MFTGDARSPGLALAKLEEIDKASFTIGPRWKAPEYIACPG